MISADRIIRRYPFDLVVKVMAAILDFWQRLFTDDPPDVILGEVACASEWMGWTFAQKGISYMIPYPSSVCGPAFLYRFAQRSVADVRGPF